MEARTGKNFPCSIPVRSRRVRADLVVFRTGTSNMWWRKGGIFSFIPALIRSELNGCGQLFVEIVL